MLLILKSSFLIVVLVLQSFLCELFLQLCFHQSHPLSSICVLQLIRLLLFLRPVMIRKKFKIVFRTNAIIFDYNSFLFFNFFCDSWRFNRYCFFNSNFSFNDRFFFNYGFLYLGCCCRDFR